MAIAILMILVLLLLLLIRCEQTEPAVGGAGEHSLKTSTATSLPQREAPTRLSFDNRNGARVPWAAELFKVLQDRKDKVLQCLPADYSYSFTWLFSYQTRTGKFLHEDFKWNGDEPDKNRQLCLREVLEQSYALTSKFEKDLHWFHFSIRYSDNVGRDSTGE